MNSGAMAQWHNGAMAQWHNGTMAFLKNVTTFFRSHQFKSFHTFVQDFELSRSTKGHQLNIQKRDLRESKSCKIAWGGLLYRVCRSPVLRDLVIGFNRKYKKYQNWKNKKMNK